MANMPTVRKFRARAALLGSAALLSGAAHAQAGQQAAGANPLPEASATAANADPGRPGLEEIVVTAQRRNERLQDVPIAISAVTAATAARQGITGTEGLGIAVPTLQFSRQTANGGVPFLRGVGSAQATAGQESPVAVYVDDVYIGAPSATLMSFNNIESTEVLKGPQGTLFGRNATGGVVNVHTKRPSQKAEVDATVGYASYDTFYGSFYANAPITSNLAANVAVAGRNQADGYGKDVATGQDVWKSSNWGVRGQVSWEPGPDTSILLGGDYSWSRGDIGQDVVLAPGTVATGGGTFVGKFKTLANPKDFGENKNRGVSLRAEQKLGDYTLRSISAYRRNDLEFSLDSDGTLPGRPAIVQTHVFDAFVNTFSQEVQLLSPQNKPFKWIIGGFYYNSHAGYDPVTTSGLAFTALGGSSSVYSSQKLNSYAGFGEASYEFLPSTKLTVGIRYTDDAYKDHVVLTSGTGAVLPPSPFQQHDSFSKLTYRAILDTKITQNILLYGSYSRGFKSGGYNLSTPTATSSTGATIPAPVVRPEVLDAYEIGLKSDLFDRRVRFNIAGYHYNYSNLQVGVVSNGKVQTINAAKARINGLDVDYAFVPNQRINIGGGLSVLDSKYTSFPNGPLYVPSPAICSPVPGTTGPLTGGNTACTADLKGNRTSRAPKFTLSFNATYTLPTAIGEFSANATLLHNSRYFWEADNRLQQPEYNLLNSSLTWISNDRKYEVKFYAKNLLNEYYLAYASESTTRDSFAPEMPRNFGGELTVHF